MKNNILISTISAKILLVFFATSCSFHLQAMLEAERILQEILLHHGPESIEPLHIAAARNLLSDAETLLYRQANVDITDNSQITPLMGAAKHGHNDMVKLLLKSYANVDAKDDDGRTAVIYALEAGRTNTARTLIDAKARINADEAEVVIKKFKYNQLIKSLLADGLANTDAERLVQRNPAIIAQIAAQYEAEWEQEPDENNWNMQDEEWADVGAWEARSFAEEHDEEKS